MHQSQSIFRKVWKHILAGTLFGVAKRKILTRASVWKNHPILSRLLRIALIERLARKFYERLGKTKRGYITDVPSFEINKNLDFLVFELPPRYIPMMPNGLGYLYNLFKKFDLRTQVIDYNIKFYHRYHSQRILGGKPIITPNGYVMKEDPWDNTETAEWEKEEVIEYFKPQLNEIIEEIVKKRPKAVGLSVQANSRMVAKEFVKELRVKYPEVVVVIGGYDCVYRSVGPSLFPDFDYMVIGEAELTAEPLLKALSRGEIPKDLPGIVSRYDSPDRKWVDGPLLQDLDSADFPRYEWTNIEYYRTYKGDHFVPITASRGCKWSRCRFCAECFTFRVRSPKHVVDEIEFMLSKGFHKFHFNESDVNGDPKNLFDICSEILRRKLKVLLMGQLRIDNRNTQEYMQHLKKAGFTHLRFGVDGWSDHTLKLQRKGYNMKMVIDNLRNCHEAGIWTAVNMVLGVPGETEEDINEAIENFVKCREYIDIIEGINTLILAAGSEYYNNSDAYKIRFRGLKEEITRQHPYVIPVGLWYSEDPYIDQEVRNKRLDKICASLYEQNVNIGGFANRVLEKIKGKSLNYEN